MFTNKEKKLHHEVKFSILFLFDLTGVIVFFVTLSETMQRSRNVSFAAISGVQVSQREIFNMFIIITK